MCDLPAPAVIYAIYKKLFLTGKKICKYTFGNCKIKNLIYSKIHIFITKPKMETLGQARICMMAKKYVFFFKLNR